MEKQINESIANDISDLENEIKYYRHLIEKIRFERTQSELDTNEMYRNYQIKEKEAVKKINTLRLKS